MRYKRLGDSNAHVTTYGTTTSPNGRSGEWFLFGNVANVIIFESARNFKNPVESIIYDFAEFSRQWRSVRNHCSLFFIRRQYILKDLPISRFVSDFYHVYRLLKSNGYIDKHNLYLRANGLHPHLLTLGGARVLSVIRSEPLRKCSDVLVERYQHYAIAFFVKQLYYSFFSMNKGDHKLHNNKHSTSWTHTQYSVFIYC